ncbi:hypothetical protein K4K55_001011 [Colletotrichum sp. SAR 10_96]|nr:hypothetical protein K4K55_001011 [Colletotrichum sp. SAR 10_96]
MKTMRNLLAKLQGITPDPYRTIRFRRDLVPHSSPSIPTGYDTSWQTRRLENYSSNPLLRLPNELLLEIMECLPPRDLYLVRQVSHLFAALFRYAAFSEYHQKNTAEIDPATAEPSVHRLLRAYRKLRGKTAPVPHFIPGVEFNLDALRAKERDSLWRHPRDLDGQRRAHQQTEALELLAEDDGSVDVPANGGVAPYEMVSG